MKNFFVANYRTFLHGCFVWTFFLILYVKTVAIIVSQYVNMEGGRASSPLKIIASLRYLPI